MRFHSSQDFFKLGTNEVLGIVFEKTATETINALCSMSHNIYLD